MPETCDTLDIIMTRMGPTCPSNRELSLSAATTEPSMTTDSACNTKTSRSPRYVLRARPAYPAITAALGLAVLTAAPAASATDYTIAVDAGSQVSGNPHFWSAAFGTGKAKLALRGDWQTHYKIGNRELGAERVRGHGLLNDEMGLYKGAGSYDWKNLDTYLTAITSANMRPIIELDFMPTALASDGDKSPPKDYNEWKNFIKALTQHCIEKYGADDVAKWYFEVWNEPDYSGFWKNTDMNAYYTLYDNTAEALVSVIPNALVGGPSTTGNGPVAAFLAHTKSSGARVAFVSNHNYPGGSNTGTIADPMSLVSDNNARVSAITSAGYTTAAVKSFNTEWNSSYSGQGGNTGNAVLSMDNHWNVGFILKAAKLLADKNSGDTPAIDVFSYWALTDVFDEDGGTDGIHMTTKSNGNTPFDTVFGVMTFQGMRKAAFNAFKMLNYLGPKRVKASGGSGSPDGVDAMVTTSASGDELQILVYNYYKTLATASGEGDNVTVNVSNLPAALAGQEVFVTQFLVDETHSNPYSVWEGQGKPASPSETQWQEMRKAQHLALVAPVSKKAVDTTFTTTFSLKRQAGSLILLGTKRPVTGRNALVEIEGEDYDGQSGVTKEDSGDETLGQSISVSSGGYVYFENVDYTDNGVDSLELRVKTAAATNVELHAETQTGALLGTCALASTSNAWATQTCELSQAATGVSKLYVVFGGAAHLNWLKFTSADSPPTGTGGAGGGGGNPGSGGTPDGGTAGTSGLGGASVGRGGAGGRGTGGSAGGTTAAGGASTNTGGGAGQSAPGSGGSTVVGSGGSTGTAPSGGQGTNGGGGANGTGGNVGNGGDSSTASGGSSQSAGGAAAPNAGAAGSSSAASSDSSSGCGCRTGGTGGARGTLAMLGLLFGVLGLRRRGARGRREGARPHAVATRQKPLANAWISSGDRARS
jgi:xylan 1,4-beta-xylosidase